LINIFMKNKKTRRFVHVDSNFSIDFVRFGNSCSTDAIGVYTGGTVDFRVGGRCESWADDFGGYAFEESAARQDCIAINQSG